LLPVCLISRKSHPLVLKYLTRTCQKDDWPRHKPICGKKLTPESALNSAISPKLLAAIANNERHPNAVVQIGPAEGGYKRSPALVVQVRLLNISDRTNLYFLANLRNGKFHPLSVRNPSLMAAFRTVRDVAAKTGDRSAVAAIGQQLLAVAKDGLKAKHGGSAHHLITTNRSDIIAQLTREYGGPVERDIGILEMIAKYTDGGETQILRLANGSSGKIFDVTQPEPSRSARVFRKS
jgi:hypothetical protein